MPAGRPLVRRQSPQRELKRTERKVRISLPGGDLSIEWRAGDDHVLMTGPVTYEYEGVFNPGLFSVSASA